MEVNTKRENMDNLSSELQNLMDLNKEHYMSGGYTADTSGTGAHIADLTNELQHLMDTNSEHFMSGGSATSELDALNNLMNNHHEDFMSGGGVRVLPKSLAAWAKHVAEVRKKNPGKSLKKILKIAKKGYKHVEKEATPHKSRKHYTPKGRKIVTREEGVRKFVNCYLKKYKLKHSDLHSQRKNVPGSRVNNALTKAADAMRLNMNRTKKDKGTVEIGTPESKRFRCTRRNITVTKKTADGQLLKSKKRVHLLASDLNTVSANARCSDLYIRPFGKLTPSNIVAKGKRLCSTERK